MSATWGSWSFRIATGGSSASSVSGGARSGADVEEAPIDPVDFVEWNCLLEVLYCRMLYIYIYLLYCIYIYIMYMNVVSTFKHIHFIDHNVT